MATKMGKLILLILIVFFSCVNQENKIQKKKRKIYTTSTYFNKTSESLEIKRTIYEEAIISNRDIEAYQILRSICNEDSTMGASFFPYTLLMASKYENADIYMDVYRYAKILNMNIRKDGTPSRERIYLDELGKDEREKALNYLFKAYEKGNKQAAFYLSLYYKEGKYFPKDSIYAEKLYNESR